MYVLCVLLHNDETWGESTIVSSLSNVEEVLGHRKSFEEVNLASCHQNLQTSSDILPSGTLPQALQWERLNGCQCNI